MAKRDYLAGKRVVVFGFGRQGAALARWLPSIGAEVLVTDSRSAKALKLRGEIIRACASISGGIPMRS